MLKVKVLGSRDVACNLHKLQTTIIGMQYRTGNRSNHTTCSPTPAYCSSSTRPQQPCDHDSFRNRVTSIFDRLTSGSIYAERLHRLHVFVDQCCGQLKSRPFIERTRTHRVTDAADQATNGSATAGGVGKYIKHRRYT